MAQNVRVQLDLRAINALMSAPEVAADLEARAERIAAAAGEGFVAGPGRPHPWIARAYVWATTREAMQAEADGLALTRAVDAGR